MGIEIDADLIRGLTPPKTGNRIIYDARVPGFGVRVTAAGAKSFVLNYRTISGQERRFTIGSTSAWSVAAARREALAIKRDRRDPIGEMKAEREAARAEREAPTIADLWLKFEDEELPRLRPATRRDYRGVMANDVLPALGQIKAAAVTFDHISRLHKQITKRAPAQANRMIRVTRRIFNLAVHRWKWRADNPAAAVPMNAEEKRERYLSEVELARLVAALDAHHDQQAADIFRLLLLTGARRGEALSAEWSQFDLDKGLWVKPSSHTKQARRHRAPLGPEALQLLLRLRKAADAGAVHLFPGQGKAGHRTAVKGDWSAIRSAAGVPDCRIHDLRHTFASVLVSAGQTLPTIGALLGHTQAATTHRYAHLADDPLRAAVTKAGAIITGTSK